MIRWKDTCRFDDLHGAIVLAVLRADALFAAQGVDCWITSVNDSTHMVGSKHYIGRAVDLRTKHVADPAPIATALRSALGPQFTVIDEGDHIHVQFNGL